MTASALTSSGMTIELALPIDHETLGRQAKGCLDLAWHTDAPGISGKLAMRYEWADSDTLIAHDALPFDPADLIALAEEVGRWQPCTVIGGKGGAYSDRAHRDTDELTILEQVDPRLLAYEAGFLASIHALGMVYRARNPFAGSSLMRATPVGLLRYGPKQHFGLHVDTINREDHLVGHRQLSFVAFLNQPTKGGALTFPRQGLTIEPRPGCAVLFPSGFTHPHRAEPVVEGVKYSAVTWLTL